MHHKDCSALVFVFFLSQDLNLIDKESEDVLERIMDEKTASESKILYGHSGPVYGISFSPDRYHCTQTQIPTIQFSHTNQIKPSLWMKRNLVFELRKSIYINVYRLVARYVLSFRCLL